MGWKLVSTAPIPAEILRRLLPEGTDADVAVVDPRTEDAAVDAVREAPIDVVNGLDSG